VKFSEPRIKVFRTATCIAEPGRTEKAKVAAILEFVAAWTESREERGFSRKLTGGGGVSRLEGENGDERAMTILIEFSPEEEAALKALAAARGLTVATWLKDLARQHAPLATIAELQRTNPEEWARQFRAWADSHDRNVPVLPDEAMSRESIYPDRL
jgi:hypothetical protein